MNDITRSEHNALVSAGARRASAHLKRLPGHVSNPDVEYEISCIHSEMFSEEVQNQVTNKVLDQSATHHAMVLLHKATKDDTRPIKYSLNMESNRCGIAGRLVFVSISAHLFESGLELFSTTYRAVFKEA